MARCVWRLAFFLAMVCGVGCRVTTPYPAQELPPAALPSADFDAVDSSAQVAPASPVTMVTTPAGFSLGAREAAVSDVTTAPYAAIHCPAASVTSGVHHRPHNFRPRMATARWVPPDTAIVREAQAAAAAGDREHAARLFAEASQRSSRDPVLTFLYARSIAASDPNKGFDLIGELLVTHPGMFDADVANDPVFVEAEADSHSYQGLWRNGGVVWPHPAEGFESPALDVNCDGTPEHVVLLSRNALGIHYLAIVQQTADGVRVSRLADVYQHPTRLALLPIHPGWAVLVYENVMGHGADANLFVVQETAGSWRVAYRLSFVLDAGEADDPPAVDGRVRLTVIDIDGSGPPELVATMVDGYTARALSTQVLALSAQGVRALGAAPALRRRAALRWKHAAAADRATKEALQRLEPTSVQAHLELLRAPPLAVERDPRWWGFHTPDTNDDLALHAAYFARNANPKDLPRLLEVPRVAAWLGHFELSVEELAADDEPLLPLGLWSKARYLEQSNGDSLALSYFYFAEPKP